MKTKLFVILFITLALVGAVSALSLNVDSVELNGIELLEDTTTKLSVERGQEVELTIRLTPTENLRNFEMRAFISGFEYNDVERMEDVSPLADLEAGVTYVKKLKLKLSDLVESDDYKLRLLFSDRTNDHLTKRYNLKVDLPRHALKVSDVLFYPSEKVKAGHALLTSVRVENKGEKDEDNVKVTVSIPSLGLSASDYIEEVETGDDEEETEELYLRLDKCTPPGNYPVVVEVAFDNNHRKLEPLTKNLQVEASEACGSTGRSANVEVVSPVEEVKQGMSTVFPITVTNSGRVTQSFTLTVDSTKGLKVNVKPSNTVLLNAGSSNTFNVLVSAEENAPLGAQAISARVNSGEEIVKELSLTAQVSPSEEDAQLRTYLEIGLVVLIVVLLVIALLLGFSRLTRRDEEYY